MNILLMLLPISLVLLGLAIAAFAWAVRKGQFDDLDTPALDILDDAPPRPSAPRAPRRRRWDLMFRCCWPRCWPAWWAARTAP
ncbi:cbb3-type cytochrome oxidase assembly protein CcoS [Pseudoxanthomonas mexicana]